MGPNLHNTPRSPHQLGRSQAGTGRGAQRQLGAVLSRSLGKARGTSPPAPAGAASGPTHNQCNQCVLLTVCQILLLSCIFSPSHHSSRSSTQRATSLEHFKSQGDSIKHRRFYYFIVFSSSVTPGIFHTVSPNTLLGERKAEQSPLAEPGIPAAQRNTTKQRTRKENSWNNTWAPRSSQTRAGKAWGHLGKEDLSPLASPSTASPLHAVCPSPRSIPANLRLLPLGFGGFMIHDGAFAAGRLRIWVLLCQRTLIPVSDSFQQRQALNHWSVIL